MLSHQHDIDVLNDLIQLTLDSAHSYEDASKDAHHLAIKTLFGKHAIERKQITAELQTEVRRLLGGKPAHAGTTMGKVHRAFMNMKAAVTGSEEGLINSVEAAEDYIKDEFEKTLKDTSLSRPVADLIAEIHRRIAVGHDEMRKIQLAMG